MSISNYLETVLLDLVFNATAYAGQATVHTKLHVGDPGEDGTGNAAAHTTRVATTFGAASGGTISNDAQAQFTSLAATETISHISLWDNATAGNCLWTGALASAQAVTAGGTLTFATGDIAVTLG